MTCFGVHRLSLIALCLACAPLVLWGQGAAPNPASVPLPADAPFTVAVSTTTLEGGPVYVADNGPQGAGFRVINGGVRNLANGGAHAATNAETQFLIAGRPTYGSSSPLPRVSIASSASARPASRHLRI